MKRIFRHKGIRVAAFLVAGLAAAWCAGAAWDGYEVRKMTGQMNTLCVGRMLIDLPQEARWALRGATIDGFDIDTFAETPQAFATRVAAREAEIRATPDRLGGSANMESVREVATDHGLRGKIFVHGRYVTEGKSSNGFTFEHYRYEGIALEAHVHGEGVSIDLDGAKYDPDLMSNLPRLLSQIVPNPARRMPAEAGFCLDRAFVREPLTAGQGERITLSARLPSHPDISIRLDTVAGIAPDPRSLLERNAASRARLPAALNLLVTDLRAAPRTIGGLAGYELVQSVIEPDPAIVLGCEWEVNGNAGDVFEPTLRLAMKSARGQGGRVGPSLSEPAALLLWDRIASSFRVRPVAQPGGDRPRR